ncbi:uncharacterized protein [Periplaneta americana]|uniref:uncharacterized protein isoform X1 n=1 Tax=Periplaneta americana TaxID=6978 RepID=UPI0037E7EF72
MEKLYIDSELLISEVEKRVCLYDINSGEYHDRNLKTRAWEEVSSIVVPKWKSMEYAERSNVARTVQNMWLKHEYIDCPSRQPEFEPRRGRDGIVVEKQMLQTAKIVQTRWRSIRDSFMKAYKEAEKSRSGAPRKKKYVFFNQLSFLVPSLKRRPTSENTSLLVSEEGNEEESPFDEDEEPTTYTSAQTPETEFAKTAPKKRKVQDSLENRLISMLEHTQQTREEDADRMFLLSLLPQFKALSSDNKMLAQIEFLQTLRRLSTSQDLK